MRKRGALVWAGAAAIVLALLIALVINIRSTADASAPTASTASPTPPPVSTAPPPQQQAQRPRPLPAPPDLRSPLPQPNRPGPAPAPEVVQLSDADRAARTMLQYDTADFGKVVETLEDGTAVGRVRGSAVTDAEQERLRNEVTKMANAYEAAYDGALVAGNEPEFARAVHAAREQFDRSVRDLYHLTEQQFFELFPHRKDGPPRPGQ